MFAAPSILYSFPISMRSAIFFTFNSFKCIHVSFQDKRGGRALCGKTLKEGYKIIHDVRYWFFVMSFLFLYCFYRSEMNLVDVFAIVFLIKNRAFRFFE